MTSDEFYNMIMEFSKKKEKQEKSKFKLNVLDYKHLHFLNLTWITHLIGLNMT